MLVWSWPVTTTGHTGRNTFFPVFQGVDKEKPNQAFFPVFYLGIFLPGCQGYFARATYAWFQPGFFTCSVTSNFLILIFQGVNKAKLGFFLVI
jgi:hypothetical protein